MSVPRYTTPTFTLTFTEPELDLTEATGVFVTFKQASLIVTKTGDELDVTEKSISVFMDQQETAQFCDGSVDIQANWTTGDKRAASEIVSYEFSKQLLQEVIE